MGYRDENAALRAQVAELKEELGRANQTIARLTGDAPAPATGDVIERSRLLDAPARVVLDGELEFELGDEAFEAIATVLRPRTVSQVGRTLTATGVSLACADGKTRVRVSGDYRAAPYGAVGCSVLVGAFGALGTFAVLHDFVNRSLAEGNVFWMAPLFILLLFPLARYLMRRATQGGEKQQRATLERILEVARQHAPEAVVPDQRVRVADEEQVRAEAEAAELEAAELEEARSETAP